MRQIEKTISNLIGAQFPQFYYEEGPTFVLFLEKYFEWMETCTTVMNVSSVSGTFSKYDTVYQISESGANSAIGTVLTSNTTTVTAILTDGEFKSNTNLYSIEGSGISYVYQLDTVRPPIYGSRHLFEYDDIDTTLDEFIKHFKATYMFGVPDNIEGDKRFAIKHILDLYRAKGTERGYDLLFRMLYNKPVDVYTPGDDLLRPSDGEWTIPTYIEVTDSEILSQLDGVTIRGSTSRAQASVESVNKISVKGKVINVLLLSNIKGSFIIGELINQAGNTDLTFAPQIIGSLNKINIFNGGSDYQAGDEVSFSGLGSGGKGRIISTSTGPGSVQFTLNFGGNGYVTPTTLTMTGTGNTVSGSANLIGVGTSFFSLLSVGSVIKVGNNSLREVVNIANNTFLTVNTIFGTTAGNLSITKINTIITFSGGDGSGASFIIANSDIEVTGTINSSADVIGGINANGVRYLDLLLDGSNSNTPGNGFGFPANVSINQIVGTIGQAFTAVSYTIGRIIGISQVNGGLGYTVPPVVTVIDRNISPLLLPDGSGGFLGSDASVSTRALLANGAVTSLVVTDSGFGYEDGELLTISKAGNANVATGFCITYNQGTSPGYWKNTKGFLDSDKRIQDSYYYQEYSYELRTSVPFEKYVDVAKSLMHPTGTIMFSRFTEKINVESESSIVFTSIE